VFSVAHPKTKPEMVIDLAMVMCHVRSFIRPEFHDQYTENAPAIKYGGQVRTGVIVVLNPRVSSSVGKKFMDPFAAKVLWERKGEEDALLGIWSRIYPTNRIGAQV
jgi:hypothetical protein